MKKQIELTSEELGALLGGNYQVIDQPEKDIENRNWGGGCICEYPNKPSAYINVNLGDCSCNCV